MNNSVLRVEITNINEQRKKFFFFSFSKEPQQKKKVREHWVYRGSSPRGKAKEALARIT